MINMTKIKSAGGAASYLSQVDDYYRENELAPTSWEGEGAKALGLQGEVDGKQFASMLRGELPDGTKLGGDKHVPGWDMTLSAPKSVSALALASGDDRLIEAHDRAVQAAVRHVEQYAATTRIKENREVHAVATDNVVAATFRHSTSREQDPQLHTHAVILNATKDESGQWRSFESRAMFRMQKELDQVYKNELARYCREAGYNLEQTKHGFEIAGVSKELMDKWSSRNEQIDRELEKIGKTRETATAAERETAALNSRADKGEIDHASLKGRWQAEAREMGADLDKMKEVSHAVALSRQEDRPLDHAIDAVEKAYGHLSERQSRFSGHDLEKEAIRFAGTGECSKDEIRQAIELARADGKLIERQTFAHDTHTGQKELVDGFTTDRAVEIEESMLAAAQRATGAAPNHEIITRYKDRDIALAREALINDAKLKEFRFSDRGDRDAQVKRMLKDGGKRVFDSQGRMYIQSKDGRIHAPDLYRTVAVIERRNIQHLGLTKTKYIISKDGYAYKQGGTLRSEAAGWMRDKINRSDAPKAVKWIAGKTLKTQENWRKCGAIESAVVKNVIASKAEAAQKQARHQMEQQAQGVKSRHVAQPQAISTMKDAERAVKAQEKKTGYAFNEGQREATKGVLTNPDRITLIQGYAGTAKTTSCLDAAAREMQKQGYTVTAMAPMHSSAQTLGESIGTESCTVAKHLIDAEKNPPSPSEKKVWIVDEASMLSAKDMTRLLVAAEKADAKLVLVGDVKQLGSVEAGAAFRQLQEQSGLTTYKLDEIVRQRDGNLKDAVYDTIRGDTRAALDKMDVRELKTRDERVQAIAKDYAKLTPAERRETIVITPGKDDRALVNSAIREELKRDGTLTGEARTIKTLETKDLSTVERKIATSYEKGDVVKDKDGYGKVVDVDRAANKITIERENGKQETVDPAKRSMSTYRESEREIQKGDRLQATAKDAEKGLVKGTAMTVEKIDGDKITARTDTGKTVTLDASKLKDRHVEHAYAQTSHAVQGKTCARVFIHAESTRANLQTQQNNYVAASRAKVEARVYTDSKEKLIRQLDRNTGQKETALDPQSKAKAEAEKDRKIKEGTIIRRELDSGKSIPEAISTMQKEMTVAREAQKAKDAAQQRKPVAEKAKDDHSPMQQQQRTTTQVSVERDGQQSVPQPAPQPQPQRDMSRDRGMER